MYGLDHAGIIGFSGFFLKGDLSHLDIKIPVYAYWLFQAAFAIAMATIVSGAVAERMRFTPYILFSLVATVVIYPVAGHWVWSSGGWLNKLGMLDFAGSAVVHSLGGWASLAAVLVLGPRTGKFTKTGGGQRTAGPQSALGGNGGLHSVVWLVWF